MVADISGGTSSFFHNRLITLAGLSRATAICFRRERRESGIGRNAMAANCTPPLAAGIGALYVWFQTFSDCAMGTRGPFGVERKQPRVTRLLRMRYALPL